MITAPRNGLFSRVALAIEAGDVRCVADVIERFGVARPRAKSAYYDARRWHLGFRRVKGIWEPPLTESSPGGVASFERGHGKRRDDCARYEDCLTAAARSRALASSPVRCPRACSAFEPRDVVGELLHLAASRPGVGVEP